MLVAILGIILIRTASLTNVVDVPLSAVEVRPIGNPQRGLERIDEENFITIDELDRLAADDRLPESQQLIYQYAPLILQDERTERLDDTFIGVYYLLSTTEGMETSVTTIQYFFFSTDENGGTLIRDRLAVFGQPIDRELVYRVTIIDGEVASAYFQAPVHRLTPFRLPEEGRPVFEVASANHNFRPVGPGELEQRKGYRLLAPMPRHEHIADPATDPDFLALAASEVMDQYGIDLSDYAYVEFQNPAYNGLVTVSIKIQGNWYYLHDSVAGLTRAGYNKAGIYVGFAPNEGNIDEIWIVAYAPQPIDVEVISVYIYPRLEYLA